VALLHPNRGTGNLPPLAADRTIFNYVATYNDFERRFAAFLDKKASDVLRFAALGTTEQGESGTQFRVDYLKPSGAIGFYHPDWVVVQKSGKSEVNWANSGIRPNLSSWMARWRSAGLCSSKGRSRQWPSALSAATGVKPLQALDGCR
jgi:hypothetical protein